MAKHRIFTADRPSGQAVPHEDDTLSTACLVGRHARCKAEVVTLSYLGPCSCPCHTVPVPDAWKGAA